MFNKVHWALGSTNPFVLFSCLIVYPHAASDGIPRFYFISTDVYPWPQAPGLNTSQRLPQSGGPVPMATPGGVASSALPILRAHAPPLRVGLVSGLGGPEPCPLRRSVWRHVRLPLGGWLRPRAVWASRVPNERLDTMVSPSSMPAVPSPCGHPPHDSSLTPGIPLPLRRRELVVPASRAHGAGHGVWPARGRPVDP